MAVYVHNITIQSGTDYEQEYDMFDIGGSNRVDLTNYTAKAQIRKHRGSSTSVSFVVGFPQRSEGKVSLTIPSYVTSRLKPGRYVYDILFKKGGQTSEILIEGNVNVRAGISTGCFGASTNGRPGSAHRLCIAVIDESDSQDFEGMGNKWAQFRSTYPRRTFYLLRPRNQGFGHQVDKTDFNALRCPQDFANKTTINTGRLISEDGD